jgi:hypothetical protein
MIEFNIKTTDCIDWWWLIESSSLSIGQTKLTKLCNCPEEYER